MKRMLMLRATASCLCAIAVSSPPAKAQIVSMESEYAKKISATSFPAKEEGTFGSKISPSTGQVEFSYFDIDVPGNDDLPVRFGRRLPIEVRHLPEELGGIGNWDVEVPYIEGTFSEQYGWSVDVANSPNRYSRCSRKTTPVVEGVLFTAEEVWHGYRIHLPGEGDEPLLIDTPSIPDPTDGNSYPWMTKSLGRLRCLPSVKNNYPGEGFVLLTPEGTKYYFDYPVERTARKLQKGPKYLPGYTMARKRIYLLATRMEDRFGNYVNYNYSAGKLSSISASDGRLITIQYGANSITASTSGRSWVYALQNGHLSTVTNPDGSRWTYSPFGSNSAYVEQPSDILGLEYFSPESFCLQESDGGYSGEFSFLVTAPSGATATFGFSATRFHRSRVPYFCTIDFLDHAVRVSGGGTSFTATAVDWRLVYQLVAQGADPSQAISNASVNYESMTLEESYEEVSGFARIVVPNYVNVYAVKAITLSGAGLMSGLTTSYAYPSEVYSYCNQFDSTTGVVVSASCDVDPCLDGGCVDGVGRWVEVTNPDGSKRRRRFGVMYGLNEGVLLEEVRLDVSGETKKRTLYRYLAESEVANQAFPKDFGQILAGDTMQTRMRPLVSTEVQQDGVSFSWTVPDCGGFYCFDGFARPTKVVRSNSSGISASDVIEYEDDSLNWVLGQVRRATTNGIETSRTVYGWKALPTQVFSFGKPQQVLTYDTAAAVNTGQLGALRTVTDGNNNVTTYGAWKRGIPQSIQYPNGTSQAASVNDDGRIDWVQDEVGARTCYAYDAMGRLTQTTYPSETSSGVCDESKWAATRQTFVPSAEPIAGLPAGHWRQTVATGNARSVTYFDGLWRPVIKDTYDTADIAGTLSQVVTRYDSEGRPIFVSYPQRTMDPAVHATWGNPAVPLHASTLGVHTEYDALGRVTAVAQDSEFAAPNNLLITLTQYLPGFQTKVTNPRGHQTITTYQMYDTPTYDFPVRIEQPEGVTTVITRDVFGKPTQISR